MPEPKPEPVILKMPNATTRTTTKILAKMFADMLANGLMEDLVGWPA